MSQFRGQRRFSRQLQAESETDLARILSSLNGQADSLRDEISVLPLQLLRTPDLEPARRQPPRQAAEDQVAARRC